MEMIKETAYGTTARKQVHAISVVQGGIRLTLKDYTSIIIPESLLALVAATHQDGLERKP